MAYSANNIAAAQTLQVSRLATAVSPTTMNYSPAVAFGSSLGNLRAPVGVSFLSGSTNDVLLTGTGGEPRWADTTNAAIFGYLQTGPRVVTQNRRISQDLTPNVIDLVADHIMVGGSTNAASWGMPTPVTFTTAAVGIPDNVSNAIINFAGTVTVNLGGSSGNGVGAYFVGSISNGSGAAGTILSVTSIGVGLTPLYVGCRIFIGYGNNTEVAQQTTITALGTGTGGTGTYTVANNLYVPSSEMSTPHNPSGKLLYIKTITANAVNASAPCVIPLAGGSAGTAILSAVAGRWALLQYNGTFWEILQSN
jgi:hypothetical protein